MPPARSEPGRLLRLGKPRAQRPCEAGQSAGQAHLGALRAERADLRQPAAGDVTYLKASGRWRYLVVVIDQYSRRLVGWQLGRHRTMDLTLEALDRAIARRRPKPGLVFHSDRGNEYAAYAYRDRLARRGITQSMNRPGSMADNAHMESFFHSMKSEAIHGVTFEKVSSLDRTVRRYIERYNRNRIHSALGYRSPIDYERANA